MVTTIDVVPRFGRSLFAGRTFGAGEGAGRSGGGGRRPLIGPFTGLLIRPLAPEPRGDRRFHRIVAALIRGAVVVGTLGQQCPRPRKIGPQPPENRAQLRRHVPADPGHVVSVGLRQPHAAAPLPVLVGIRVIQPQQRAQHRPEMPQIIDLHLVQQIGDVRIGDVDQFVAPLGQFVQRLVDQLHRICARHALLHALAHRRQVVFRRPVLGLGPLQPVRRGQSPPRLGPRHVRVLDEFPHGHGCLLYDAPVRRRRQILRVDDGEPTARGFQFDVELVPGVVIEEVPASRHDVDGGGEVPDRFAQVRDAPGGPPGARRTVAIAPVGHGNRVSNAPDQMGRK